MEHLPEADTYLYNLIHLWVRLMQLEQFLGVRFSCNYVFPDTIRLDSDGSWAVCLLLMLWQQMNGQRHWPNN